MVTTNADDESSAPSATNKTAVDLVVQARDDAERAAALLVGAVIGAQHPGEARFLRDVAHILLLVVDALGDQVTDESVAWVAAVARDNQRMAPQLERAVDWARKTNAPVWALRARLESRGIALDTPPVDLMRLLDSGIPAERVGVILSRFADDRDGSHGRQAALRGQQERFVDRLRRIPQEAGGMWAGSSAELFALLGPPEECRRALGVGSTGQLTKAIRANLSALEALGVTVDWSRSGRARRIRLTRR